jgi:uncharacterized protein YceH (UPF0502 family)
MSATWRRGSPATAAFAIGVFTAFARLDGGSAWAYKEDAARAVFGDAPAEAAAPGAPADERLDARLAAIEKAVGELKQRLGEPSRRSAAPETIEERLTDVEERVKDLKAKLADLEQRLRRLESRK